MRKKLLLIACLVVSMLLAAASYLFATVWIASKRFSDDNWRQKASIDDYRTVCHNIIRTPFPANKHDAYLDLELIGNAKSVPILINSLRWQDEDICTTDHCLEALKSLTGTDAGNTYQDWAKWWKETGSQLPQEAFYPRSLMSEDENNIKTETADTAQTISNDGE